ncbi:MAG: HDOD domain-containing protein, partial [Planctomycetota bacterium]
MDNENQIRNLISKLSDLPTTKSTFLAILNLYQNPYATMKDLEDIVKNDISLTTRILKLVNSSFYGLRNQVTNIEIAVRLLGIGTVKTIALATSVFDFVGFEHIVNKNGLWLHSWMVGFLAKTLAERFSLPDRDILFLAGLLHDIGKLILSKYLSVEYKLVLARLDVEDIDEIRIEKECFNFTHDYLGGLVLKTWGFHEKV